MNRPETIERLGRLLSRAGATALLPYIAMAVLLAIAIVLAGNEIEHHIGAIEAWIQRLGPAGVVAFGSLFVLATSALIPDSVLAIMAGALFGLPRGTAAVAAASLLAAALQYAISRGMLRQRIEHMVATNPTFHAIQWAVRGNEVRLQALLRLTPLNPATTSYVLGATGVRFPGFMLACLALVPSLFAEVYFGHAGKHIARMAGRTRLAVYAHDAIVIGGLAVTLAVLFLVSRMARRAVMQAAAAATEAGPVHPMP